MVALWVIVKIKWITFYIQYLGSAKSSVGEDNVTHLIRFDSTGAAAHMNPCTKIASFLLFVRCYLP